MASTFLFVSLLLGCQGSADHEVADASSAKTSEQTPAPAPAASYATPEDTFDTAREAMMREDFGALVDCLSPDGRAELAGTLRLLGGLLHAMGKVDGAKPNAVALSEAVEEAGKAYQQADAPQVNLDLNAPEEELRAQIREAGSAITDQRAFVVAMLDALAEHGDKQPDRAQFEAAVLEDLKIDGDRAEATISVGFLDGRPTPVVFRKLDGAWKIDAMGKLGTS
ncbi:MAG: hypothetical protein DWQ37_19780 [Planctomycetota bacterium]|nr:MAG: hypothetical protein DWQ37_19780 [Planctomycetota bacterium]